MRTRPTWLLYLLVLPTGGYFALVWLVLMLRDANLVVGRRGGWAILSTIFLGGLVLYFAVFVAIFNHSLPVPTVLIVPEIVLGLALTGLWMSFVVIITNRTRSASGLAPSVTEAIAMVVLSILVFISLPILQRRLNRIAQARSSPD